MDINATLWGQMITFALFVWFTMKYVWPLLEETLRLRHEKISEGLQAAERGHKELEIAQKHAIKTIKEAREKASEILEHAHKQADHIIEAAKNEANAERNRIVELGRCEIEQERRIVREQLRSEVVELVVLSTEKLLSRAINDEDKQSLLLKEGLGREH